MFKNTYNSKPKNIFLPFEEMTNNGIYAFTYNPIDQPKHGSALAVHDWFNDMKNFFMNTMKYSRFRLYTEVSKEGRFHFHGFINVKDVLRYTIHDVPSLKSFGTSCVKTIKTTDDYAEWLSYCNKQQNSLNDYLTSELYSTIDPKVLSKKNPDGIILIDSLTMH